GVQTCALPIYHRRQPRHGKEPAQPCAQQLRAAHRAHARLTPSGEADALQPHHSSNGGIHRVPPFLFSGSARGYGRAKRLRRAESTWWKEVRAALRGSGAALLATELFCSGLGTTEGGWL